MSLLLASIFITQNLIAETYEVPPSSSTNSHVPYISDAAMEQCVELYNKAKWLGNEIGSIQVDSYSQTSVNNYNKKVAQHSQMTNAFNKDCAGKQSESAYKAAQKLNSQNKSLLSR